jgi:hypothetical protein
MSLDVDASTLCTALQAETEQYERALTIAEGLPAAVQQGQDTEPQLEAILTHLRDIARIEQRIADPKQRWLESKAQPHPDLEPYRIRLMGLIQQLQERLRRAEQEATLRQSRLLPELESLLQGQRMQRAYGAVVNQTADVDAPR